MLKIVLLNVFVETVIHFLRSFYQSSKEQNWLEIEIFYNIKNGFTVTFDYFNANSLNKSINKK